MFYDSFQNCWAGDYNLSSGFQLGSLYQYAEIRNCQMQSGERSLGKR